MAWDEEKASKKPFVSICVPHWGQVSLEWASRTFGPLRRIPQPDFDKKTILLRGILNIDTERNELVKEALEDPKCTHILFLDTDVTVHSPEDPNLALRMLLACNAPVASGIYRAIQRIGFNWSMWTLKDEGYRHVEKWTPKTNWIEVDAIGMGFSLFKVEVFKKIPPPWFKWHDREPSEDFYFCKLLKKYGYEIRVLTDVQLAHIHLLKVKPDGSVSTLEV